MSSATMISIIEVPVARRACRDCVRELNHCHGALIRHADGTVECTEYDCAEVHFAVHEHLIECAQLGGECGCETG